MWYTISFARFEANAVLCPHSCHRESHTDPYKVPYTNAAGSVHQENQVVMSHQAETPSRTNHKAVCHAAVELVRVMRARNS